MKNYSITCFIRLLCFGVLIFSNCSKRVVNTTFLSQPLNPLLTDSLAGSWKPILLALPNQIPVAAPAAVSSLAYQNELTNLKARQKNMTGQEKQTRIFWSAGQVFRWNEILRGLVSKHNLPPYQATDGTYPIPNPVNPFNYPEFPFSNPPYAARAYAYISAAQYDGLVAAYYYKALYHRSSPATNDPGVNGLNPKTTLPSYPSEAGVLAGVTTQMMKLLFPTELEAVVQLASEAKASALLSGEATQSDLDAGDSLGRHIADLFIAKAKTDRAGIAVGTPAIWARFPQISIAAGEIPWISLENPKRPPMLPLFGNVKSLLLDSATIVALRPGPPPSTSSDQMKKEVELELYYSQHPTAENIRITQFWADGVGTSTPSGHWNAIAADDFLGQRWSEVRWARGLAFLNMTLFDAAIVCWNTKFYYYNPRASQLNPAIKTLTGVPNFPSYISGHSTFSGAAAGLLAYLVPSRAGNYQQMALEASNSRIVSGIHYKTDCIVGLAVGNTISSYAIERIKKSGGH